MNSCVLLFEYCQLGRRRLCLEGRAFRAKRELVFLDGLPAQHAPGGVYCENSRRRLAPIPIRAPLWEDLLLDLPTTCPQSQSGIPPSPVYYEDRNKIMAKCCRKAQANRKHKPCAQSRACDLASASSKLVALIDPRDAESRVVRSVMKPRTLRRRLWRCSYLRVGSLLASVGSGCETGPTVLSR